MRRRRSGFAALGAPGRAQDDCVAAERVDNFRRFHARSKRSRLVLVVPDRLAHPAPVEQQRIGRPAVGHRSLIRAESRSTKQHAVFGWRQEGQQIRVRRSLAKSRPIRISAATPIRCRLSASGRQTPAHGAEAARLAQSSATTARSR
jgi:hypothetical protein